MATGVTVVPMPSPVGSFVWTIIPCGTTKTVIKNLGPETVWFTWSSSDPGSGVVPIEIPDGNNQTSVIPVFAGEVSPEIYTPSTPPNSMWAYNNGGKSLLVVFSD